MVEYCNLLIIKNKEKWLVNENGKFLHYECSVVKNRLSNKGALKMRFEKLDTLFINVFEHGKDDIEVDVIYKPIGMHETETEEYFIRLTVQTDGVGVILENEQGEYEGGFLTEEEELFVLQHYAMHTVHDVAKQYKEVL